MIAHRNESGWRATALVVALFAITLNFLQPLAHAALMRDGTPSSLWTVFCNSSVADPDADLNGATGKAPAMAASHDCCLGLAHAPAIAAPSNVFVALAPIVTFVAPLQAMEVATTVGIRDGPAQPRGPPTFV
jgi:hypothetical protein